MKNLIAYFFVSGFLINASVAFCGEPATLHFDLNACASFVNGSNADYSEFTAEINNTSDINLVVLGNNLYRNNSQVNKHSCTPGVNDTKAMCVSYDASCTYSAGSERAVRFDVMVTPISGKPTAISDLKFYEKAPLMFEWIDGATGINDFPTFYAVRVLKEGAVVFEQAGIRTTNDWTLESFNFSSIAEFTVTEPAIFNFELLAYCPNGNFAMQSVWDLDEISLTAVCPVVSPCVINGTPIAVEGGDVSLEDGSTSLNACVGDIVFNVMNTSNASVASYYYIITDSNDTILDYVDASLFSTLDLSSAPAGECHVWGWSEVDQTLPVLGESISSLNDDDCEQISNNFITVVRVAPLSGSLAGGPFAFCVGDGIADTIAIGSIVLSGNSGPNSQWIVTDEAGNILGLPPTPSAVDFDGAGAGTCLIWHVSYENGLEGLEGGKNILTDLLGCYSISDSISVVRSQPEGGILEGGPFAFCVGDGTADTIALGSIVLSGNSGSNSQWIITDEAGNILGLPPMPSAVDFDDAGAGTCLIWHISFENGLEGLDSGMNIMSNLEGCYSISNSISVVRSHSEGGVLEGGPFEFCVGDGTADTIALGSIVLSGNVGLNSQWVITDEAGNILGLPATPSDVDFDGAGGGTCLVWNISYDNGLEGLEGGMNIMEDLTGCYSISNSISVVRIQPEGGVLEGGPFAFCVGDGNADNIENGLIALTGNSGPNNQWIITDDAGMILGLPQAPSDVDFDGAGAGTCLVWHISYENGLQGLVDGNNVMTDLEGCFGLSNSVSVVRSQPEGGVLEGGPFAFCVGDGITDTIAQGSIILTGNSGFNSQWIITDQAGIILGLPPTPSAVDFDGAGTGTCLVWHLSYENGIQGLENGNNVMTEIEGCFGLSNSISVVRAHPEGGVLTGGPFEFCVGDGVPDNLTGVSLNDNSGSNSQWVVTSDLGVILGLPLTPDGVDFDVAGEGTCLVWHVSYEDGLMGLEEQSNLFDLVGCFELSNFITVNRIDCIGILGGVVTGGPFTFCVGDGVADNVSGIALSGSTGMNNQWIVASESGEILGLPALPEDINFDIAGAGTCLIMNVSFDGVLDGLEVGNNISDLSGEFALSNAAIVIRNQPFGGVLIGGPFEFCVGDQIGDFIPAGAITLSLNSGTNSQWVIANDLGDILGLPGLYNQVDFNVAGVGMCFISHLSYEDGLLGLVVGNNLGTDLDGCFSLSNSIPVNRVDCGAGLNGGMLMGGPFEFCVGDSIPDMVSGITLSGTTGPNNQWLVTNAANVILALPVMPSDINFDGSGAGECFIWNIGYTAGLSGLAIGNTIAGLMGAYDLSDSIVVVRNQPEGGSLLGGPFEFCVGDGVMDTIAMDSIVLIDNVGPNSQWVVTDDQNNILGLPNDPSEVDFDGAIPGTCLIWHLSYADGLVGAEMGNNLMSDLDGCYSISDSIPVTRITCVAMTSDSIVINEINENNRVELKNVGSTTIDVSTYWLCQFPSYNQMSSLTLECGGDLILEPGELITVVLNFDLTSTDGELGLYKAPSFGNSSDIIDYLQWGSAGHQRESVAVGNSIWTAGDFVPMFSNTESLVYDGIGNSSMDWTEAVASPCMENSFAPIDPVANLTFNIFPNPAYEFLTIDFKSVRSDVAQVFIYNRLGSIMNVMEVDIRENNKPRIDISNFPEGTYFIKVISRNRWEAKKFIKMK